MQFRPIFTRRRLLQASGLAAVASAFGRTAWPSAAQPSAGEAYAGFLLLPWGAAIPPTVRFPRAKVPTLENLTGNPSLANTTHRHLKPHAVPPAYKFPIYHLSPASPLEETDTDVVGHISGDVFAAHTNYLHGQRDEPGTPAVSVTANPFFPRPYPVFPGGTPDDGIVDWERVYWTPQNGIALYTGQSNIAHWIDENVLFTLVVTMTKPSDAYTRSIVSSLHKVNIDGSH